jgi:hypothetical protein
MKVNQLNSTGEQVSCALRELDGQRKVLPFDEQLDNPGKRGKRQDSPIAPFLRLLPVLLMSTIHSADLVEREGRVAPTRRQASIDPPRLGS